VATLTAERARALLGGNGELSDRDILHGHDVLAGHASGIGMTLITTPRHFWPRLFGGQRQRPPREKRPGGRLIGTGAVLLVLLGAGLLAVSYAAQYRYVLDQRHQAVASLIEAGALDVGLIIFSLLALGLAMAGLASKTERAAVVLCAVASAVMNYAAADVTSARSVLAFCMPPVFLAFVVDRDVSTVRRHVLGIRDGRSPWAALAVATARLARFAGLAALYGLRFLVAAPSTCAGLRRAILAAAPLPTLPAAPVPEIEALPEDDHALCQVPAPARAGNLTRRRGPAGKQARLISLAAERHDLPALPLAKVSGIATALAPEAGIHPSTARRVLLAHVRELQDGGEAS
jgi:hypothetical protein